jgi:hypothetical protein
VGLKRTVNYHASLTLNLRSQHPSADFRILQGLLDVAFFSIGGFPQFFCMPPATAAATSRGHIASADIGLRCLAEFLTLSSPSSAVASHISRNSPSSANVRASAVTSNVSAACLGVGLLGLPGPGRVVPHRKNLLFRANVQPVLRMFSQRTGPTGGNPLLTSRPFEGRSVSMTFRGRWSANRLDQVKTAGGL